MSQQDPGQILRQYWGYSTFRPLQEEIIQSVIEGSDTLALLPTGGGKSICFQVPGLSLDGMTIVISPLIALMKDQVEQLNQRGIPAVAIYSGMTKRELDISLDNGVFGHVKFLYVSPERLKTELFQERAKKMNISLVAVDEAHCISQWGYDFRPPYLEIKDFLDMVPTSKVIALTATATKDVKEDILAKLGFKDPNVYQKSFSRKNLSYSIFHLNNKTSKLLEVLRSVPGSSVVYVRSRKKTREIAELLWRNQINADFYHAGLNTIERAAKQDKWIRNETRVIVATNAFGMGIDKPDVRTVIHLDIPDTLEAYYQEAGRGGRDEKMAYAVLLYDESDVEALRTRVTQSAVPAELLRRVYQSIANHLKIAVGSNELTSFEIDILELIKMFNLPPTETFYAIKKLEEEGLIQLTESFKQFSKVNFLLPKDELYRFQVANANLDPVIKGLLRLYGGELFQSFLRIKEKDLAQVLGISVDELIQKLKYLHELEVLIYDHPSSKPKLTFLTPRQDASKLQLNLEQINQRNLNTVAKMEAVISYLKNTHRCRTQQLQEYFDEISYINCGVCDNCLTNKKRIDSSEMSHIKRDVLKNATTEQITLDALISAMDTNDKYAITEAVRELLEEGKLKLQGIYVQRI